jgi:hypothetical protein
MRSYLFALALVSALSGGGASAAPVSSESNADALITKGLELRRKGQAADALELFQKAHAIQATPRTFGQMGLVEASLGRWVDAEVHLGAALASPADPWVTDNRKLLDKALSVSRQHIGELVLEGPEGTHVQISGLGMKTLPLAGPLRVSAGEVRISAIAPGYKQLIRVVKVEAGKQMSIVLDLAPNRPAPVPTTNVPPGSSGARPPTQRR